MEGLHPFTIESFYKYVGEKRLMGAKCRKCGFLSAPPRPMCPSCLSQSLEWEELPKEGRLLTYTLIHVSPKRFQELTPYAVGIVQLQNGSQLPGMIRNVTPDELKIGLELVADFETEHTDDEWPQWPRYYFKPLR